LIKIYIIKTSIAYICCYYFLFDIYCSCYIFIFNRSLVFWVVLCRFLFVHLPFLFYFGYCIVCHLLFLVTPLITFCCNICMYDCISFSNIYTIYVHCRKIYNLFARALETDRRASLWQRVQINFIFNDNVRILCLSCDIKKSKTTAKFMKIAEASVVLIVFNGVVCDVSAYTVVVSFCRSTWIRYQKCFNRSMTSVLILLLFLSVALHESGNQCFIMSMT
jgi:hypothetical protein